jgi:hypothetical protein
VLVPIRILELLHSVLVHEVLVGEHSLLGLILVDTLSKAFLGSQGGDNWVLDGNRHFCVVAGDRDSMMYGRCMLGIRGWSQWFRVIVISIEDLYFEWKIC